MEILSFKSDGNPHYANRSQTGRKLKQQCEDGYKHVGTLGQPLGKFDFLVKYSAPPRTTGPIIPTRWDDGLDDLPREPPTPPSPPIIPPVLPCYKQAQKYLQKQGQQLLSPCNPVSQMVLPQVHMMSPAASYEEEFPPLRAITKDGSTQQPKMLNPRTVEPDGTIKKISPAEAVMNWQSENLIVQNKVLQKIDHKISQVEFKIDQSNIRLIKSQTILERLEAQIQTTHLEMMRLVNTTSFSSRLFTEKEAEMKSLQTQLVALRTQAISGFSIPSTVP
ncbi:hypothetical protein TIFTF001_026195 [Ficus carica]|uniref:Uncharacterized protein n=1 Tax=Ficus carica TaxID=3494 RepID=A0AA88IXR0_FICCA|nr:hypothetical protein TIFTF001_026195 [Ficus carica]